MALLTVPASETPAQSARDGRFAPWLSAAAGLLCVALGVGASALFLPHQSIWHDETVQLSGIRLEPVEQVRWLAGRAGDPFGVGLDRMPPLSYIIGWAWSHVFGAGETSMRWLGAAAVGLANLLVFLGARRAWGLGPGLAAALMFGLSPNVVVQSVEIRAYPLLILASAAALLCLLRLLTDPDPNGRVWLVGLACCGVAATYLHFFGLVLAGGMLLAALIVVPARGGRVGPVALACAIVGVLSLGLAPFVTASTALATAEPVESGTRATGLVRLAYRLVCHPAMLASRAAVGLALVGALAASAAALTPKRRSSAASVGLLIALASGTVVVTLAQLAQSKFAATSPNYNVWMLPALSVWLASGLASVSSAARKAALGGIILLVGSDVYSVRRLAVNGDFYAHTSYRAVETLIRAFGPDRVAVIHDADGAHAWTYFVPTYFEFGGAVPHYAIDRCGSDALRVTDYPGPGVSVDPLALAVDYLIVVRAAPLGAAEVAAQVRDGVRPLGDGPVAASARSDARWSSVSDASHPSFVAADVAVFRRVAVQ